MKTPIGERIWKDEAATDTRLALLISVTLHEGDDLKQHIAPFIEATKRWWQARDRAKEPDFLITVLDQATRHARIREILVRMISEDNDLRLIFSSVRLATLIFGTFEGVKLEEHSLKIEKHLNSSYAPAWTSMKWIARMDALLAATRQLREETRQSETTFLQKKFPALRPAEPDVKNDEGTPQADNNVLLHRGRVTWAYITRAFFPAYVPGSNTHYGSVVYGLDENEPDSIFELAWMVNQLRKTDEPPPKGTEKVAASIRDDQSSFSRIKLPEALGAHGESYFANLCIHRNRLPLGYLHDRLLPILVAPAETEWCCILPLRYWPPELKTLWTSGPPAYEPDAFKEMFLRYKVRP